MFGGCALFRPVGGIFRVRAPEIPSISPASFQRTADIPLKLTEDQEHDNGADRRVSVRFLECKFSDGMRQLSDLSGVPISWDKSLDGEFLSGSYVEQPLSGVLRSLAQRFKVSVVKSHGMYFIGESKSGDVVSAVIRVPPADRAELEKLLSAMSSNSGSGGGMLGGGGGSSAGKAVIIGSFIWVQDTLENVQKLVADIDLIRERSERSYLAEIFFIRVSEDDFLRLTAQLRVNQVDVFSSSFNISKLFSMFVDADGKLGSTVIDTRPVLLLSEGRKSSFEVGTEITRERRSISDAGTSSTSGYEKFQDGIILSILLNRISAERYSLDLNLEISNFDRADTTSDVPAKYNSILKSPGMLVKDGGVVYAGSLKRKENSKVFGLFSVNPSSSSDLLTIWIRCRAVR
jgi:hypothetical protein